MDLGHSLPLPFIIPLSETLNLKMGGGFFTCGGTLKGNSFGQSDSCASQTIMVAKAKKT